ncbi:hypothetical protein B0H14DRAFT_2611606 [Mycena olivaceomarginata]|nr:hypothetical protein B0H14DRAFT_2611606 [Mycena olivaceomarginata]
MPTRTQTSTAKSGQNPLSNYPGWLTDGAYNTGSQHSTLLLPWPRVDKLPPATAKSGNLDEEREKARERMARLRKKVLRQEGRGAAFFERAREASRKHRKKNAAALAHRQRILRLKAYDRKHKHHAWLEHHNLREERCAAAQEAPLSNDDPQEDMVETGWYPKI